MCATRVTVRFDNRRCAYKINNTKQNICKAQRGVSISCSQSQVQSIRISKKCFIVWCFVFPAKLVLRPQENIIGIDYLVKWWPNTYYTHARTHADSTAIIKVNISLVSTAALSPLVLCATIFDSGTHEYNVLIISQRVHCISEHNTPWSDIQLTTDSSRRGRKIARRFSLQLHEYCVHETIWLIMPYTLLGEYGWSLGTKPWAKSTGTCAQTPPLRIIRMGRGNAV